MSRPRRPFGAQQPGRLQSTMMKVLAAEMSDPQRLRRGKQYAKDGSVTDIVVEAGVVTCEVQGSRTTPYIAALEVTSGGGMPLRRDVVASCTCPDDVNGESHACKHVLATMFTFAEELLIEPELLDVWRANEHAADRTARADTSVEDELDAADDGAPVLRSVQSFDPDQDDPAERNSLRRRSRFRHDPDDDQQGTFDDAASNDEPSYEGDDRSIRRRRRHLELVREGMEQGRAERREQQARRVREPMVDPLADVLAHPHGTTLPDVEIAERPDELLPKRPELAAILRDAYRNLRLDWD